MLETERETAISCPHARTARRVITSDFFKREFLAEVDECRDCGVQLWTRDTYLRFHQWMVSLKREKRDLFQIQFYMPTSTRTALVEMLRRFPGVPMSALIRGMTAVYLSSMTRIPDFQRLSQDLAERPTYHAVTAGERKKTSLHFSPVALLDIQTWAEVLKLSSHKIVEEALYRLLALQLETDPVYKALWERELSPQLQPILRSV